MKRIVLGSLMLLISLPAFAVCTIDIPQDGKETSGHTVSWVAVPGANFYTIEYSSDAFATTRRVLLGPNATSFDLSRTVSYPADYSFRVTALNDRDPNFLCSGTTTRFIPIDIEFRRAFERAIIPVVASIPGAFGSRYKTSLRLTAQTALVGKGKIIFHPAGSEGTDDDPSIPYSFSRDGESIVFDDVVAAFGTFGVGSIDIVPAVATFSDPTNRSDYIPIAEAHIYNETPSGTFGSFEHQVQPIDFLTSTEVRARAPEKGEYRVNVGFRTLSTATMNFDIYNAKNDVRLHRAFTYPPNYTLLTSPEALLGTALAAGESLAVYPERGSYAIPFYTYSESGTNDPTLFVPEFPVKPALGPYDVAGHVAIQ